MPGGLINIISKGGRDMYLTGDPQITYFKYVYRRHTNFSFDTVELPISTNTNFDSISQITIPIECDLIHKCHIKVSLPEINFKKGDYNTSNDLKINLLRNKKNIDQNNYNVIKKFMEINMESYRNLSKNILVEQQKSNLLEFINQAINIFTSSTDIMDDYNKVLQKTYKNTKNTLFIENFSNLYLILTTIKENILIGKKYSNEELTIILKNFIKKCQDITKYYYDQTIQSKKSFDESKSDNIKFAWVKKLGHVIFDYIEIHIGGEKVDKHLGTWLDIYYELSGNHRQSQIYDKMIGNVPELILFNNDIKPQYDLYIPLSFWFNKDNGLALPLIALETSPIIITIKLKKLQDCAYIERLYTKSSKLAQISLDNFWENQDLSLSLSLIMNRFYLDDLERKRFAQAGHEYLIENIQYQKIENISTSQNSYELDFRNPTKELYWIAYKNELIQNNDGYGQTSWDNYSLNDIYNPFLNVSFSLIGNTLIDISNESRNENNKHLCNYFNFYVPYTKHTNAIKTGINVFSFSLFPEKLQPSGECNFSRILDGKRLNFLLNDDMFTYKLSEKFPEIEIDEISKTTVSVYVFCMSYNVLRIIGGFGRLAYDL